MTKTIREYLEAIRDRHEAYLITDPSTHEICILCEDEHPCPDYSDATAALALVDADVHAGSHAILHPKRRPSCFKYEK